jgi:hypothetical protein
MAMRCAAHHSTKARDFRMDCSSPPRESVLLNRLPDGEAYAPTAAGSESRFYSTYALLTR